MYYRSNQGQVILILLLVMTVALAIGLSVVQRSLSDLSTSTKIEQSSRAFSAAEAGIERALQRNTPENVDIEIPLDNNSVANVVDSGLLPNPKQTIEYPPINKEEIIHVWFADPNADFVTTTGEYYKQTELDVYWGELDKTRPEVDNPAIELTIISLAGSGSNRTYTNKKFLLDPNVNRQNNFLKRGNTSADIALFECNGSSIYSIFSNPDSQTPDRQFFCRARLRNLTPALILIRGRILYSNGSHPVAVAPVIPTDNSCNTDTSPCSFPRQVRIIQSYGTSGDTQRVIQLFKIEKVVPFYLDYAIFAAGDINK